MMYRKKFFVLSFVMFLSGCHSSYDPILINDAPFCGPQKQVEAYAKTKNFAYGVDSLDVYWEYNGKKKKVEDVTKKCELSLKNEKCKYTIESDSINRDVIWLPKEQKSLIESVIDDFKIDIKYSKTKTIVCVDPVIVLVTEEPRLILPHVLVVLNETYMDGTITETILCTKPLKSYFARNGVFLDKSDGIGLVHIARMGLAENSPTIILNRGYICDRKVKYEKELFWFSPDLNISPRPVQILSETKAIIPVPWGRIVLTKKGDEWIVSAEGK